MQAVVFVGLQAAGKSSFYRERFFATHVRVSLDLLRTRHREAQFLRLCLETRMPFVVDNTNPTRAGRRRYLEPARQAGFGVVGYYFQSRVEECWRGNSLRPAGEQVPLTGLLGTAGRLELPDKGEGFDELYYVRIADTGFVIEEWKDAV